MDDFLITHEKKIKKQIDEIALRHKDVKTVSTSPRWLNFGSIDENDLIIQSTQISSISFKIPITEKEKFIIKSDISLFWSKFRKFRNEYLEKKYNIDCTPNY